MKIYNTIFLIFSGICIGLLNLKFSFNIIFLCLAIAFLIFVWFKEEFGILFIIIITASVIYEEQLPVIQSVVGNFHLIDIFLFFSLISILIKIFLGKNEALVRTPLDIPLIVFYGLGVTSLVLAVSFFSVSIRSAFSELRIITYYLVFFLVTNLVRSKPQLKSLINGLFVVALLVVGFIIVQAMVGTSFRIIPARIESLLTLGQTHETTIRVITPGNSLIFVMLIVSCCTFVVQRSKFNYINFLIILFLCCGLIISFNRNLWIPAILVMILFFILASSHTKIRFIGFTLIMLLGMAIFTTYAYITGGKLQAYTYSTYNRLASLTKGQELVQRGTLIDRIIENRYAFDQIKRHPIWGIGLGNTYRPEVDWNPILSSYIHNGYLWILMKIGLFGFISFMWFLILAIIRGFRYWKYLEDSYFKGVCIGFTLASLGFMISASVNPVFMQWHSAPIIGLMVGGNELIFRLHN